MHVAERTAWRDDYMTEVGATRESQERCDQREQQFQAIHQAHDAILSKSG
jgi:hypothetical protein